MEIQIDLLEQAARIAENYGPNRPILTACPHVMIRGRWEGEQAASAGIAVAIRALRTPLTSAQEALAAGNTLATICHAAAATAGWWNTSRGDVRNWPDDLIKLWVGTKLALVHSEVSEGLEGYRKNKMDDHLPHRPMLEVELADAVIRIMDLAGGLDMDIGGAIAEKLQYNANRLDHKPEHRNAAGGKTF